MQVLLLQVQHADLQRGARFGVLHQVVETAPRALQFLEVLVMHDGRKLLRHLFVDRRDCLVEGLRQVLAERDGAGKRFGRKGPQQVLHLVGFGSLGDADGLVEQAKRARLLRLQAERFSSLLQRPSITLPLPYQVRPQGRSVCRYSAALPQAGFPVPRNGPPST